MSGETHVNEINVTEVMPTHQKLLQLTHCKVVYEVNCMMLLLRHHRILCVGLLLTTPCRVMGIPSEALLEEGYDSNMQFGLFIQDGVVEEYFVSMDEVEKSVIEVVTAEPGESEEGEAVPILTSDDIKKMKVMELQSALQERGMTTNGLKVVLVSRLEDAVKKNVPMLKICAPEVIEHSAGGDFAAGDYWKKLDPEAEVIDEGVNVDGIRFRGPTVPAVEHENNTFEDQPKKRNYSDMFDRLPFIRETILLPQRTKKGMLTKDSHAN